MKIRIETDDTAAGFVEQQLLNSLRQDLAQSNNARFVLVAKTDQDRLVAGLVANASYGWLLIKALWVEEAQRRQGLGTSLMNQIESRGHQIGCHSAWLDTSSPPSKLFYEKLGYRQFSMLRNSPDQNPASHCRWFMSKTLQ